jgi:serine-type D-Ala-D-Ala carboxypeptidase/endopeptidase (penicillin-binding protein 4)
VSDLQPPTSRRAAREASTQAARKRPPSVVAPDGADGTGLRITPLQRGLIIGAGALVFVLLATGSIFFGISVAHNAALDQAPAPQSTSATRIVPASKVQPTAIPTCSLDTLSSNPALIKLYGSVVETATGASLYANNDTTAEPPASVLKVLTASAAISVLGPGYQITTSVDPSPQPGTVTLVGQGDATLSATGHSVYAGAPTLASLATAAIAKYNADPNNAGVPISHVILDSSYWDPSDNWDSSVPRTEQTGGYLSESTALQVDGDRQNPAAQVSPRSTDPVMAAGAAFVRALKAADSTITSVSLATGKAEDGAVPLASVQSQPVSTLVKQMLLQSDNTLAEMLARIVSVKESLGGSGSSIQQATTTALGKYGLDTSGLTIEDGSGESDENQIPPLFMSKFMSLVSQKTDGLQYVAAGIPVVGKYSAKSGSIASAYTLSGYTTAADGTGESFTFFAQGTGITSAAQPALAALAGAVYTCGKNITNN